MDLYKNNLTLISAVFLLIIAVGFIAYVYLESVRSADDFSGGTRITVLLEKPVNQTVKDSIVNNIKRKTALFLIYLRIQSVNESAISIDLTSGKKEIELVKAVISNLGTFVAIIDGKVAMNGEHVNQSSIRMLSNSELVKDGSDWGVVFEVDQAGARQFTDVAKGKEDKKIYLFFNRPNDVALFYMKDEFKPVGVQDNEALIAFNDALSSEEGDIAIYLLDNNSVIPTPRTSKTEAIIPFDFFAKDAIKNKGYVLIEVPKESMEPEFKRFGNLTLVKLDAIGLFSALSLSNSLTNGSPIITYMITGKLDEGEPKVNAQDKAKEVMSLLKNGDLPLVISLGQETMIPYPDSSRVTFPLAGAFLSVITAGYLGFRYIRAG